MLGSLRAADQPFPPDTDPSTVLTWPGLCPCPPATTLRVVPRDCHKVAPLCSSPILPGAGACLSTMPVLLEEVEKHGPARVCLQHGFVERDAEAGAIG